MPISISACCNTGAEDDQASPQGGPTATAREPPPPSETVVVTMEVTPDHRDEDIRMALSRIAGGREVHILRGGGGGDSLRALELMLRSNADPGKCIEPNMTSQYDVPDRPVLCSGCSKKSVLYVEESTKFSFSEIQAATSNFSKENLLGEGEFGHVYKGQLKDGQVIAAKLRRNASSQGYTEFLSEVQVHSFARHRNIVMLLGYCCKESYNILVYEYICNNSLEWHLFDKSASLLVWHKRHAIALGMAKGLHFLHAECRPGPIIHRDLHPSNVLLTHDFFPMLGNFARAKWKAGSASTNTRILERSGSCSFNILSAHSFISDIMYFLVFADNTSEFLLMSIRYLAPEYAECGTISVKSDVYTFGILLFQLISGRKVLDDRGGHILQWAEPLVEILALHELMDDRIKDTYDTYGLYSLAKAAYLCVRRNSEQRPSMGEVVRLIDVEDDHVRDFSRQFIPKFAK